MLSAIDRSQLRQSLCSTTMDTLTYTVILYRLHWQFDSIYTSTQKKLRILGTIVDWEKVLKQAGVVHNIKSQ